MSGPVEETSLASSDLGVSAIEVTEAGKKRASRAGAVTGSAPRPFVSVDAWLAATGMDPASAERVRPYLTTATGAPNVELAFARQELIDVLPFLSRSQKKMIAEARAKSPTELKRARITRAAGADVLPAFSEDGRWLMWTSQRGGKEPGQERASSRSPGCCTGLRRSAA